MEEYFQVFIVLESGTLVQVSALSKTSKPLRVWPLLRFLSLTDLTQGFVMSKPFCRGFRKD